MAKTPKLDDRLDNAKDAQIVQSDVIDSQSLGFVAGEAIAVNDAVCLVRDSGVFKVFKTDLSDSLKKNSFIGVAIEAASVSESVRFVRRGFLTGQSSLTVADRYYLGTTAGEITNMPPAQTIQVGHAISATVLYVTDENGYQFESNEIFVRSMGNNDGTTGTAIQNDTEHFDFTSWSAGASAPASTQRVNMGDNKYGPNMHVLNGTAGTGTVTPQHRVYNKSSWSSETLSPVGRTHGCQLEFQGDLAYSHGGTVANWTNLQDDLDIWNGSSWQASVLTWDANLGVRTIWNENDTELHEALGVTTGGSSVDTHSAYNGSSIVSETAQPGGGNTSTTGGTTPLSGMSRHNGNNTNSWEWDSSSWSSTITVNRVHGFDFVNLLSPHPMAGSDGTTVYVNGGTTVSGTTVSNATDTFASSAWAADTASTNSRCAGAGALF